jgi:hypothetical protein
MAFDVLKVSRHLNSLRARLPGVVKDLNLIDD